MSGSGSQVHQADAEPWCPELGNPLKIAMATQASALAFLRADFRDSRKQEINGAVSVLIGKTCCLSHKNCYFQESVRGENRRRDGNRLAEKG